MIPPLFFGGVFARRRFAIDGARGVVGFGFSGGSAAHYGHCKWFCSRPKQQQQQQQQGNCRQDWRGACLVVTVGNAREVQVTQEFAGVW